MNLIIHADDFGMTKSINDAIIELCKLGTLSSTSIMANMPYSHEAKELLSVKNISLGLHSTFTQGKPVSDSGKVTSLIDEKGFFLTYQELLARHRKGKIKENEVFLELENQYLLLKDIIGESLCFIDSHHSIHNKLPSFTSAFIKLGKKHRINAARTRQMHYLQIKNGKLTIIEPNLLSIHKFRIKKIAVNHLYKRAASRLANVFKIVDGMLVDDRPGALIIFKQIAEATVISNSQKSLYIVAHPATNLNEIDGSNLNQERIDEYNYLKSESFLSYVSKSPLTNFNQL